MAEITKQALKVDNNQSFPNNNNGAITPAILRAFNVNMIDSLVDEVGYTADSSSWNQQIDALEQFTASASGLSTGSLLVTASAAGNVITFTKGNNTTFDVTVATGSGGGDVTALNAFTASQLNINTGYNTFTQSANTSISNLNSATASLFVSASLALVTASITNDDITFTKGDGSQFTIQVATGSFALSASYAETASYAQFATDIYLNVKNTTGAQLNKGTVVRIIGATGDNALIATASWTNDANSANTLGLLYENIANDGFGKAITQGTLLGIDTDPALGYTAGQLLYLSSSGQYTNVKPDAPYHEVRLGQVLRAQQNNGSMYVLIQNGYELDELHDVDINTGSLLNNDLLAWDSASQQWTNKTLSGVGATTTSSFNSYTSSTNSRLTNIETTTASLLIETQNLELFSASALTSLSNLNTATASLFTSASLSLTTASVSGQTMTFTKGDGTTFNVTLPAGSGSVIDTASFATTGSNTFTGDQTLVDNAGNFFTISDASGSLMLVAKGFTSASAHMSASAAGIGNIIFKTNSNTADTIISGSGNIFTNASAPQIGLKRYIGGSNNIINTSTLPQISGSMQFSPSMNANYTVGQINMRGPVSSSAWSLNNNYNVGAVSIGTSAANHAQGIVSGLNISSNNILGAVNIIANRTNTTLQFGIATSQFLGGTTSINANSSSIQMTANLIGGANTINNNTTGSNRVSVQGNGFNFTQNIMMGGNTITASGSNDPGDTGDLDYNANIYRSLILGNSNTIQLQGGLTGSNSMVATSVIGNGLIVTGSSPNPQFASSTSNTFGSEFIGRFNAVDGNRAKSAETIFAVGTGTSTSNRKTGFLIDSSSNSFFEGTVNISGSLLVNGLSPSGVDTGSFATTGSNSFNGNQIITGSLLVSEGLTLYTSSQISIGRFPANIGTNLRIGNSAMQSNVSGQSGIAIGLGTMQFLTSFSEAIAIGANTMANAVNPQSSIAIGGGAMQYSSGSNQSIAIGQSALALTTGSFNTAIGGGALSKNTAGGNNFAMGNNAMFENTTGNQNVAIGVGALYSNVIGSTNIAIGNDAMIFSSGSSMNSNIAIGASALTRNQVDSQIAIGANALQYATTGNANTAIGRLSMQNSTTATDNTAIGANTLLSLVTGVRNIAIGKEALRNVAGGIQNNTAIGWGSLYTNAGNENTAIGNQALENLQTGSDNTAIGFGAGSGLTGNNSRNTLIGANIVGTSNWNNVVAIADGANNIKFFNSGSQTTLTNNTLISGSLTTTGSATIGTVLQLTQLNPLPTGADGQLAVSASNLYFYSGSAWNKIAFG